MHCSCPILKVRFTEIRTLNTLLAPRSTVTFFFSNIYLLFFEQQSTMISTLSCSHCSCLVNMMLYSLEFPSTYFSPLPLSSLQSFSSCWPLCVVDPQVQFSISGFPILLCLFQNKCINLYFFSFH